MKYVWKCNQCGHDTLEEVTTGVVEYSEIAHIEYDKEADHLHLEYGQYDTVVLSNSYTIYQCRKCGIEVSRKTLINVAKGLYITISDWKQELVIEARKWTCKQPDQLK